MIQNLIHLDNVIDIQMPNEIFNDFSLEHFENYGHRNFSYGFYYLSSFLYRNAVYGRIESNLSSRAISDFFLSGYWKVSYITKRDGVLDKLGYTKTTYYYPTSIYQDDSGIQFELHKELSFGETNMVIKRPLKGFIRTEGDEDYSGTFYRYENTHRIKFKEFLEVIKLGYNQFYLYGYLRFMTDKFPQGYIVSNKSLAQAVGCSARTVSRYTKELEERGLISSSRISAGGKLYEKEYRMI